MGDDEYGRALREAEDARRRWETNGEEILIPAVGLEGPVAMPMAEAYEYYGTPRGAVPSYVNAFALMSRAETLPYDAQAAAPHIRVPTLMVHSEKALVSHPGPEVLRRPRGSEARTLVGIEGPNRLLRRSCADRRDEQALGGAFSRAPRAHVSVDRLV